MTPHPEDGTAEPNTLVAVEGKENPLPSTINLPISAKNVSYEVKINLANQEERLAVIDEKKTTAGQKAAEASSKRIQSYIILGVEPKAICGKNGLVHRCFPNRKCSAEIVDRRRR